MATHTHTRIVKYYACLRAGCSYTPVILVLERRSVRGNKRPERRRSRGMMPWPFGTWKASGPQQRSSWRLILDSPFFVMITEHGFCLIISTNNPLILLISGGRRSINSRQSSTTQKIRGYMRPCFKERKHIRKRDYKVFVCGARAVHINLYCKTHVEIKVHRRLPWKTYQC